MSYRRNEITAALRRWLARYSPPAHMSGNAQAMQDELDALVRAIDRAAPREDVGAGVAKLLDLVEQEMRTRAWPTVAEIAKAARVLAKDAPSKPAEHWEPDAYTVAAAKMAAGEAVSEAFVYGPKAKEMLRRGLVRHERLEDYRKQWASRAERVWGKEIARSRLADLEAMHAAAEYPTTAADLEAARNTQPRKMEPTS